VKYAIHLVCKNTDSILATLNIEATDSLAQSVAHRLAAAMPDMDSANLKLSVVSETCKVLQDLNSQQ